MHCIEYQDHLHLLKNMKYCTQLSTLFRILYPTMQHARISFSSMMSAPQKKKISTAIFEKIRKKSAGGKNVQNNILIIALFEI